MHMQLCIWLLCRLAAVKGAAVTHLSEVVG